MGDSGALHSFRDQHDAMLSRLRAWVEHESPSRDKPALDSLAARLSALMESLGGESRIIPNKAGGNHLLARFTASSAAKPALVLGHLDTVWPRGTLERMPCRVESGRFYGPGALDMKASLVLIEFALSHLKRNCETLPRPIVVLLTSDEEIGSPTSRPLIESLAREAAYALVLEPPLPGGRLKTARKGVGSFQLEVTGKAAHAGIAPEQGASAVIELAYQILAASGMANPERGTTINVGLIQGGTAPNVVAASARATVDVRVRQCSEAQRILEAFQSLTAVTPGTTVRVEGSFTRPPMERTPAIAALFGRSQELAERLGLMLSEGETGGASDGNLTAALGLATLDGLGALGEGAHAADEHVLIESLPERAALLATLLREL